MSNEDGRKQTDSRKHGLPEELASRVEELVRIFEERKYGLPGTPQPWEIIGQTTSKLKVVVRTKQLDPDGTKRKKYISIINAFDADTGTFPHNFDPKTGEYIK